METPSIILNRLKNQFRENRNSHIFLFETNDINSATNDIKELIINILNANETIANQIKTENYLELIIIRPDGKEIKKDQIFALQERLKNKPVLSEYLFYIIINAEKMNETSENKLLKTIEEPNENVIGFMLTTSLTTLLPTIKSRTEINYLLYQNIDKSETDEEQEKYVVKLIELIETQTLLEFNLFKDSNKKIKDYLKENGKVIVKRIKDYYNTACNISKNSNLNKTTLALIQKNNTYKELITKTDYLNKTLNKLIINMNTDLLLEKIFIELEDVKKNANSRN